MFSEPRRMPCFLIQPDASHELLARRVLAEHRVAHVVVRRLERDARVHAAGLRSCSMWRSVVRFAIRITSNGNPTSFG
jgi:hypothetical protein